MCWSVKFVLLILISTVIDYYAGLLMEKQTEKIKRKKYLILSLVMNLGLLAFFKYFNFFNDTFTSIAALLHLPYNVPYLNILLPVGISFYTFQTLSYTIDVYRGKRGAEHHFGYFALYVSFFPQLVAGPIERSTRLLPQFYQKQTFEYQRIVDGLKLMAWGFFQKVVIADRLAMIVNPVFNDPHEYSGLTLLIATYGFAFQILCDFAGYSDIAIGSAQIMGIKLMTNFKRPFFAESLGVFWTRWHISLTTWFKDYLFIPLSKKKKKWKRVIYLFITFLITGLWHGANWTFIVWGGIQGFCLIAENRFKRQREKIYSLIGFNNETTIRIIKIIVTFHIVVLAGIFFRAKSVLYAMYIGKHIFWFEKGWSQLQLDTSLITICISVVLFMLIIHFMQTHIRIRSTISKQPLFLRLPIYLLMILSVFVLGIFNQEQFIYFQF